MLKGRILLYYRYGISGFPTLKFFPKGNKDGEDYDGGRDVDDFVSFINEKSGTNRDAKGQLTVKVSNQQCSDFIFYSSFMVCSILCSLVGWFSC